MKVLVISYSMTGNNNALAVSIASELNAQHLIVKEHGHRSMFTIVLDILFNRTPRVYPMFDKDATYELVIFMGPVWMGKVATPLRAYFNTLRNYPGQYAFITISGGSEGGNFKLDEELLKRTGKKPAVLLDMHIVDLLPPNPKPTREQISDYHLSVSDIKNLTNTVVKTIKASMAKFYFADLH